MKKIWVIKWQNENFNFGKAKFYTGDGWVETEDHSRVEVLEYQVFNDAVDSVNNLLDENPTLFQLKIDCVEEVISVKTWEVLRLGNKGRR